MGSFLYLNCSGSLVSALSDSLRRVEEGLGKGTDCKALMSVPPGFELYILILYYMLILNCFSGRKEMEIVKCYLLPSAAPDTAN